MLAETETETGSIQDEVAESSVEALIGEKDLGARLKRLRLKRSMGLVELGQLAGLSASYLSQLETGRVVPTLRNLTRIAMVHKIDISYFFAHTKRVSLKISRARDRIKIPLGSKERPFMFSQSMSSIIPDQRIVPCIAELQPGFDHEVFDARPFEGLEFACVLSGEVKVTTSQRSEVMETQDILWIEGSVKRQYRCVGDVTAKVLIVSFPQKR